jgi:hypothetical protein
MAVGFGFSVGDFIAAAGVIVRVIKAFDAIEGSQKQYVSTLAFLRGLQLVCDYLARNEQNLSDDVQEHANTIASAYGALDEHLQKFITLNDGKQNGPKRAFRTVKWAFDELNGKVQKMKDTVMDAVSIVETYVVFELRYVQQVSVSGLN